MDVAFLRQLGLNENLAKAYIVLIQAGSVTPVQLAGRMGLTRTNAYSVLDKLAELGLAHRCEKGKKLIYRVANPTALQDLMKRRRDESLEREKLVRDRMPLLLNYFYTYSEQPGVRYYQGKDGIKEMYLDQVRTKQPIVFIRSQADLDFFGFDFMHEIRMLAVNNKITRHAITPDTSQAPINWRETDPGFLLQRTWLPHDSYDAPVEWGVYGDKVYTISFGDEAMGMIIESPQIAQSLRQILALLDRGIHALPGYDQLPKHAARTAKGIKR